MPPITLPSAGKRCRCGARRDKNAKKCRKCQARSRYRRKTYYQKVARHRARQFRQDRNQRKDMPS